MYAATGKARMASEEERTRQRAYAVDNLRDLAGYAATKGIRLALEPLNRFETDFLNTVDQGVELLDAVSYTHLLETASWMLWAEKRTSLRSTTASPD